MRFEEALKAMREGKRVTRKTQNNVISYIIDKKIMCEFLSFGVWKIDNYTFMSFEDILSEDWEIVDE